MSKVIAVLEKEDLLKKVISIYKYIHTERERWRQRQK